MSDIDVDKLREESSLRRNTQPAETPLWQCHYCKKSFIRESSFMRHTCKEMIRQIEIRSKEGQAAYQFYIDWMKLCKYKAPSIDAFMTSRYYTSFYKFAVHVQKIHLDGPAVTVFMRLMVERDLSPTLWVRHQCYSIYIEFYDKMQSPMDQVINSIELLVSISDREEIELSNIFTHLGVHHITELVALRKLSPWLLFCSRSFGEFLKSITQEDWDVLQQVINPTYWAEKLENNKDTVAEIVAASNEVGL